MTTQEGRKKLMAWLRKKQAPTTQLHGTLFALACMCREAGFTEEQGGVVVRAYAAAGRDGRTVPEREIEAALRDGFKSTSKPAAKWPRPLPALMAECDRYPRPVPYPIHRDEPPEFFLGRMFSGDPLLCCGMTAYAMDTRPLSEWRGMLGPMQFVVPSPMMTVTGPRKGDGQESFHAESNTGPREYLVTEFDGPPKPAQMARIASLRAFSVLDLVTVVDSGGKSLHGYWRAKDESSNARFFEQACRLGADSKLWLRSQFSRMPGGTRERRRQEVLFFDL